MNKDIMKLFKSVTSKLMFPAYFLGAIVILVYLIWAVAWDLATVGFQKLTKV